MTETATPYETLADSFQRNLENALHARETAEARKAELLASQAAARAAVAEAQARAEAIAEELRNAENAAAIAADEERIARRAEPPQPIDRGRAIELSQSLLDAFSSYESSPMDDDDLAAFWEAFDDVGARLLTPHIDDAARPIVVAANAVLRSIDRWLALRGSDPTTSTGEASSHPSYEAWPGSNAAIKRLLVELEQVIDGTFTPPARLESVGTLVAQGLSLNQLCRAVGLERVDGAPALDVLGGLIDAGLSSVGFYSNGAHGVRHLAGAGFVSIDDAMDAFSQTADQRRQRVLDRRDTRSRLLPAANPDRYDNPAAQQVVFQREVARIERERRSKLRDELKRKQLAHAELGIQEELDHQFPL